MKYYYIFDNSEMTMIVKNHFKNDTNTIINGISQMRTINELTKSIIDITSDKSFDIKNTHLFFSKPKYNTIDLFDVKNNDLIVLEKNEYQNDYIFKFYLDNFVSEDGSYEDGIIDMKYEFLLNYLDLFNISYKSTDTLTSDFLIDEILLNIKNKLI